MKCNHCGQEIIDGLEHVEFPNAEHKVCLVRAKAAASQNEVIKASDVIHSRASWASADKLGASESWEPGKVVRFMYMPAGVHTICAGFRDGSIELTVKCDEATAKKVQASLDQWRSERPRQEPFGCIEHREHEASVCVSASCGFEWKEDGVYLAAEPTSLGANNVNGKVHRSWSPSFTTDADYHKAKDEGGTLRFPDGVRGSRSNPAEITGVDFCVGTLTNKPAFIEMRPVKGSEKVAASGNSEGAKKGWEHRGGVMHIVHPEVSGEAHAASAKAEKLGTREAHLHAADLHEAARTAHYAKRAEYNVGREKRHFGSDENHAADLHGYAAARHEHSAEFHRLMAGVAKAQEKGPLNTVLAREASAQSVLDKVIARNKPQPVTIEHINAKYGKTVTGDTRKTPDEILARIYARSK